MIPVETPIAVMQRSELKYVLTPAQTEFLKKALTGHVEADPYGLTSIASLYYDTPDHRLIRASLCSPPFKEKIRLRSYGVPSMDSPVFLELKRKSAGTVYKRRVQTTIPEASAFFEGKRAICTDGQIGREIAYFRNFYGALLPSCMIIYDRIAYIAPEAGLRLTIDHAPRYRMDDLELTHGMAGTLLLPEEYTILEIKVQEAMPLWLCKILWEGRIYKTSFSKYGAAYEAQRDRAQQKGYLYV